MDDVTTRHNEKMKRIKAARDKIMATKTEEKGLIIVHTGAGKGKSSSAFGMIMRCIAHGMPCAVVQFIKGNWETGEKTFLRERFADGDYATKKGPVFATAIISGVMAAKRTHELIPFCHPLGLTGCDIDMAMDGEGIRIRCRCRVQHRTGVEMEALTGASVAALTVYDMCKAVDKTMRVEDVRLAFKEGGKSGVFQGE